MKVTTSYVAAWGWSLATAAMGAAFGLFLLYLLLRRGTLPTSRGTFGRLLIYGDIGIAIGLMIVVLLMTIRRRWFFRRKPAEQWAMAGAIMIAFLGMIGMFLYSI
jgi:hypothetical protein